MSYDYKRILRDGIWDNNVVFSQMLALCPLLAVTGTATNGLGMGVATLAVLICNGGSQPRRFSICSNNYRTNTCIQFDTGHYRASAGAGLQIMIPWLGPVPMRIGFASPFMKDDEDQTQFIFFQMGSL